MHKIPPQAINLQFWNKMPQKYLENKKENLLDRSLNFFSGAWILLALGIWLIVISPSLEYKNAAICVNDLISGLLLSATACYCLARDTKHGLLIATIIGVWLQFAPLVWSPPLINFLNDTLVGTLVVVSTSLGVYFK